ncbi:MAG: ACP S-malonyltransferase [Pseudomonadota bacterium]
MSTAFVFPGQGSQSPGMGAALAEAFPDAREVFEEVDDALSQKLSSLMFEGPEDELNLTENTQPALMSVSMAVMRVLNKQGGIDPAHVCAFMAGHSLGEYSALTAAGSFDVAEAAKLLKIRGQAMQKAVPVGVGAMAAILGLDLGDVQDIAGEASDKAGAEFICDSANDNSVGQVVVSGHKEAVAIAVDLATEKGAKKAVTLPVSAPFHCALMAPAAVRMADALADADIRPPVVPIVANVTAKQTSDPAEIRTLLVDQVTGMVRWRESVMYMKEQGVERMVEIGSGKVLCGLVRRIDKEIETTNAGTPEDIETLIEKLKG